MYALQIYTELYGWANLRCFCKTLDQYKNEYESLKKDHPKFHYRIVEIKTIVIADSKKDKEK